MEISTEDKTRFLLEVGHRLYIKTIPIQKKADELQKDLESFVESFDDLVNEFRTEIFNLHDIPYEEMENGKQLDKANDILSDFFFSEKASVGVFLRKFLKEIKKIKKISELRQ